MLPETACHVSSREVGEVEICFYQAGQGTPVVLIHGMFGDFLDWEPVLGPLSESHRVVALDLPGFGASGKPRLDYTADFFVSSLRQFLRGLGIEKAAVVGNSFGGQIAMLHTLQSPESVARLVLVDSGGFQRYTADEIGLTESRFNEATLKALTPEINRLLFAPVFAQPSAASVQYIERQNAKLQRSDYPDYAYAVAKSISLSLATCLLDRLAELQSPTLLVWGENDGVVPVSQARLALALLEQAELTAIPGCGHAPQLECPAGFLSAVKPFLKAEED